VNGAACHSVVGAEVGASGGASTGGGYAAMKTNWALQVCPMCWVHVVSHRQTLQQFRCSCLAILQFDQRWRNHIESHARPTTKTVSQHPRQYLGFDGGVLESRPGGVSIR
jgi:hypothetical protein